MLTAIYFAAIVLLVAADYIIKLIVSNNMTIGQSIPAIKGLLNWTYITNDGASWGMLGGKTIFLVVVTFVLIGALIYVIAAEKVKSIIGNISFVLIAAGGIGNLIDRVFNGGRVVDYIDISPIFSFPIFNFADCCVTVGGVLFCIFVLFFYESKEKEPELAAGQDNETI